MSTTDDPRALAEMVLALRPSDVEAALHQRAPALGTSELLATGVGISPGSASGRVALSVEAVLDAVERDEPVVLVTTTTSPADDLGLRSASAVVTASGGWTSHAAIITRAAGVPAVGSVAGADIGTDSIGFGSVRVRPGEWVTVDGDTGQVRRGAGSGTTPPRQDRWSGMVPVLAAADRLVGGRPSVMANADTSDDARTAAELGAVGIGLARSEHMFGGDVDVLWRMLTTSPGRTGYADAAEAFDTVQRRAFATLLATAAECFGPAPVTIRLLDAPAEEFGLVGTPRGVRLAAARPDVYRAQLFALSEAIGDRRRVDDHPAVRLLVPMVTEASEVAHVAGLAHEYPNLHEAPVGAMVETPAAALTTDDLVRYAAHVSFGTNDLTQFALGLDRDRGQPRDAALDEGDIASDPFRSLHRSVVELIRTSAGAAHAIERSMCGELASSPEGLDLAVDLGLDSISCAPFSVPSVRLGLGQRAARAVLGVC